MKSCNSIKHTPRGFTLVELAIVITIIGILIGGVLKGQQLIDQARLAATINQVNNYRSALMIFKTTYNELPGDMRDPDARIVGCSGCVATDSNLQIGDGFVGGLRVGDGRMSNKASEVLRYWLHLYKANMITGVTDAALTDQPIDIGTAFPAAKIGGGFTVETAGEPGGTSICYPSDPAGEVWGREDGCQPSPGIVLMIHSFTRLDRLFGEGKNWAVLTPQQAASADRKMDDGKPLTGAVRGASMNNEIHGCANSDEIYPESETNANACTLGFLIES